jgi:hypothetical protein
MDDLRQTLEVILETATGRQFLTVGEAEEMRAFLDTEAPEESSTERMEALARRVLGNVGRAYLR